MEDPCHNVYNSVNDLFNNFSTAGATKYDIRTMAMIRSEPMMLLILISVRLSTKLLKKDCLLNKSIVVFGEEFRARMRIF